MAECDYCWCNVEWAEDAPESERPEKFKTTPNIYRCVNPECGAYMEWKEYNK